MIKQNLKLMIVKKEITILKLKIITKYQLIIKIIPNRKKKQRVISPPEKGKLKNNVKPININSNEEIITIDDEEKAKNSKKNNFK